MSSKRVTVSILLFLAIGLVSLRAQIPPKEEALIARLGLTSVYRVEATTSTILSAPQWDLRRSQLNSAAQNEPRANGFSNYVIASTVVEATRSGQSYSQMSGLLQMFTDCERLTNAASLQLRESTFELITESLLSLYRLQPNDMSVLGAMAMCANRMRNDSGSRLAAAMEKSDPIDPYLRNIGKAISGCKWKYGKPVDLHAKALTGAEFHLRSLKGKVVLIDFWSTTCAPCISGMPQLEQLRQKYAGKFEVVGISLDEDIDAVRRFLKSRSLQWPVLCDGKGWNSAFATTFGVTRLPSLWLIDQTGRLREVDPIPDFLERKIKFLMSNDENAE